MEHYKELTTKLEDHLLYTINDFLKQHDDVTSKEKIDSIALVINSMFRVISTFLHMYDENNVHGDEIAKTLNNNLQDIYALREKVKTKIIVNGH